MDSMAAPTLASSRETPLPAETANVRAVGRIATATGMPQVSRPVTSATRETPTTGSTAAISAHVCCGATSRWVPSKNVLAPGAAGAGLLARARPRRPLLLITAACPTSPTLSLAAGDH
jgi:hypothetical protein